ncbi:VIPR1 protein, partial [Oreotrochilus melanogaster]|nr:VIPR1 protein [Oreotrochilus melanogaster]
SAVLIQRNCSEQGWSVPSPPYPRACQLEATTSTNDTEAKASCYFVTMRVLYTCGYSLSLAALVLAISIFCCFRKLHCTRNSIHIHFFSSFILRGAAVLSKDFVLFWDESLDHCSMATVSCKAAIAFFQFSVLANFFWLLVEGLYLQTLLLLTFTSEQSYTWLFILLGWGECSTHHPTTPPERSQGLGATWDCLLWMLQHLPDQRAAGTLLPMALPGLPKLLGRVFSCRAAHATPPCRRMTKSTLLLIPLFGVHYVVFALCPEDIAVAPRLCFELVLGSYQ